MSAIRTKVKSNAKVILKSNWLKAIGILLIVFFLATAISSLETALKKAFNLPDQLNFTTSESPRLMWSSIINYFESTMLVSLIFSVFTFILTTPLLLGQVEWYWNLTERKPQGIEGIFTWFGSLHLFIKSIWLKINIALRLIPWFLLTLALPYSIIFISMRFLLLYSDTGVELAASVMMIFGLILLPCGAALLLYVSAKYFLASYILVEDSTRKVNRCVRDSIQFTRGLRSDIFTFWLSFAGWFILCVFLLPMVYVLPYFYSSSAVYAKYIIYSRRLSEAGSKKENMDTIEFKANSDM